MINTPKKNLSEFFRTPQDAAEHFWAAPLPENNRSFSHGTDPQQIRGSKVATNTFEAILFGFAQLIFSQNSLWKDFVSPLPASQNIKCGKTYFRAAHSGPELCGRRIFFDIRKVSQIE